MRSRIATHHFFNPETQRGLLEKSDGYVDKEESTRDRIAQIRRDHRPERMLLLHLGQNPDGCAPGVADHARELMGRTDLAGYLGDYPESLADELRVKLAVLHRINPEHIMISSGLDQMIDMIAAAFIEPRDRFMVTNPGFFLFDEYSRRHGGVPVEIGLLEDDDFAWTQRTVEDFERLVGYITPKLIWIANPNNPTGRLMDRELLEQVLEIAHAHWITVVVDEAYGEYTDVSYGVRSASSLLRSYDNLIVLRTFSKAYGLAGLRVGYAMTHNQTVLQALRVHRQYFPVTQFSLDLAGSALDHIAWLDTVRRAMAERRGILARSLAGMPGVDLVDSDSGIAMLRCLGMTSAELSQGLEGLGVIVAPVPGDGVAGGQYIRLTFGKPEEMTWLAGCISRVVAQRWGW